MLLARRAGDHSQTPAPSNRQEALCQEASAFTPRAEAKKKHAL
jgi:hypothetical protein